MTFWAAAGSVLGGLLGKSKQKVISAGDNRYSDVEGIMRAAKDFGFNPLTLLSQGSAIGPTVLNQDNSAFGAGIANAFALAGDAVTAKRAQAEKLNNYQTQNKRLTDKVNAITLRAPVPGVYGTSKMPSDPEVYGNDTPATSPVTGVASSGGPARYSGAGQPLVKTDVGFGADGRRAVDNTDVKSHPGYMLIDNPAFGIPIRVPTLDGDEPLHWYEYPSLALPAISYGVDIASTFDASMNGNFDGVDPDAWKRRRPKARPFTRMDRSGGPLPLKRSQQGYSF